MTFINSIRRQLQAMSATERQRAISSLRDLIYDHAINRANTLHSLFHGFLSGFRGVSTKRLDEYLAWFLWRRTYTQDRESIAVRQVNVTPCDNTVRDWAHVMPPYMDYWGVMA